MRKQESHFPPCRKTWHLS